MSLESFNYPPLIAALSVGTFGLLPSLHQANGAAISWTAVKVVNLAAYGLSLISVSRPGRYDGQDPNSTDGAADGMEKMSTGKRGRSLVAPAGWAFVIWAPIFLGEMIMVASQLVALPESSPVAPLIRQLTYPHVAAQIFQTLWTASFRPKYQGLWRFVSAMNLSGVAYSLSFCHALYTQSDRSSYSTVQYLMYFLPLSLHFGWTTAASLVNINGMVAMGDNVSSKTVAWLGHISVVAATALGVWVTTMRSAPVYGGVIAWALAAVASGMKKRIHETVKEDPDRVGVYGAKTQRIICVAGAVINASVSILTAVVSLKSKSKL
jgi:hypothetical protein